MNILYSLCRIELKKWYVELNIENRLGYRTKFRIVFLKETTSNTTLIKPNINLLLTLHDQSKGCTNDSGDQHAWSQVTGTSSLGG